MAARTISEIKEGITAEFMRNVDVARAYGFEPGASFSQQFSKVSVESLIFYIVAAATWTLEQLFALHREEVEQRITALTPHRPRWYRDKVLAFMKGRDLQPETDEYDTAGMSAAEIAAEKVVKHAAVTENADASILTIKVAGESAQKKQPLDQTTEQQLLAYIAEVKDAGVRIALVNQEADTLNCTLFIGHSKLVDVAALRDKITSAVRTYVESIPFGGQYSHAELTAAVRGVEGVRSVGAISATATAHGEALPTTIEVHYTPASGYFRTNDLTLQMTAV